jgi:hypothetical protein
MSAEEAFFACTFLEENAQIQLQAEIHGAEGTFKSAAVSAAVGGVLRAKGEAGRGREPANRAPRPASDRCGSRSTTHKVR